MPSPSLSVAMCTYNGEKYLQQQLDSLVAQTRRPDELVICDDASTDRTAQIIDAFGKSAPFATRTFTHAQNIGRVRNFDFAISRCSGDIIFLSDQDDVWHAEKIELMSNMLVEQPDADGVFANAEVVDSDLRSRGYTFWDICGFTPEVRERFRQGNTFGMFFRHDAAQGASLAFRSSCRSLLLPISPDWGHDSWIAILLAAADRLIFIERTLMLWRQHESNLSGDPSGRRPNRIRKLRDKIRDPRGYYQTKLHNIAYAGRLLDDLADRLLSQPQPARFENHLAIIEQRRKKVQRRQRTMQAWVRLLGGSQIASQAT